MFGLPPTRIPVTNEGLVRDSLLKMECHPGGDCYCVGGSSKLNVFFKRIRDASALGLKH